MNSSEKGFTNGKVDTKAAPADYETALQNAGQGKYQYAIMGAVGLFYIACAFQTFSVSYLLPSAECDLQMTSRDKGFLNSSPFVVVAWGIIPRPWLLGSHEIGFRYNSWRIFIAVSSLPSLLSALAVFCFPESPAFLLTRGKHDEALEAFQRIYHMNTGRPKSSFPIKRLELLSSLDDVEGWDGEDKVEQKEEQGKIARFLKMLDQMADLFRPPLLKNTMIGICSLFSLQLGYFGFGMWFPELFNRFEEFSIAHPNETASVCEVANMELDPPDWLVALNNSSRDPNITIDCSGDTIQPQVFINTFSIGSTCICSAILTGLFVERIGRRRLI
ncbi:hypothetical protein J437_LFUL011734, partial [Ladona fulva]